MPFSFIHLASAAVIGITSAQSVMKVEGDRWKQAKAVGGPTTGQPW
jgi:hypothetical protein